MKANNQLRKIFCFITVLFVSMLIVTSPSFSKEAKKVAVLPFTMNTQQDLIFLQKGIFDMFLSRISYGDEVVVLTRENLEAKLSKADPSLAVANGVNELKAKKLGAFLGVDYVLFGSLTLFGQSMSLDANMVDIKNANPTLSFFRQSDNPGAVIPELNAIAEEINFKVFGRETQEYKNMMANQQIYEGQSETMKSPLNTFKTLLKVDGTINSIAVGDLDGDKKNEVVIIYDRTIQIFEYSFNGRLIPVQKIEDPSVSITLASIDVGDINQNGYDEIFVTRINNLQQSISSYMIEFDGSKYVIGKKRYPWYFRIIKNGVGKSELFAQIHNQKGPWHPNLVFNAIWNNNEYVQGTILPIPIHKTFNVLSMVDVSGFYKTSRNYLYTSQNGSLVLFNKETGQVEWSSDEGYGGSTLAYQMSSDDPGANDFKYIQPKNDIYDIGTDDKPELFVIKNIESSDYLFENTRLYKKGMIEIMTINEMGLSFDRAPKKFSGRVVSIAVGDYDNDAKMELMVTMMKKDDLFSQSKKSIVVAYELE